MNIPKELRAPLVIQFLVFAILLIIFGTGISNNANKLKEAVYDSCVSRGIIERNANDQLDQLIDNAAKSTVFNATEKADRISSWRALRRTSEVCVRL